MTIAEIASFVAVILAAYASYRTTTRKAEVDKLQERIAELEKRLADTEQRATANEHRALDYRKDVIRLGEQLEAERLESIRRLSLMAQDGNKKINAVVIVLEKLIADYESETGKRADVDLEALQRLTVKLATDRLGTIDIHAVRQFDQ